MNMNKIFTFYIHCCCNYSKHYDWLIIRGRTLASPPIPPHYTIHKNILKLRGSLLLCPRMFREKGIVRLIKNTHKLFIALGGTNFFAEPYPWLIYPCLTLNNQYKLSFFKSFFWVPFRYKKYIKYKQLRP